MPPPRLLADTARYGSAALAPPRTLVDVLKATAARHPRAAALDDGETRLDYAALLARVAELAERFARAGIGRGDRVGIHIPLGTAQLYLAAPAASASTAAIPTVPAVRAASATPARPGPEDDAWIIFTSGSTGTPKGVAVTHRAAAAFVDAEARLFLRQAPLGPGDRVLAGLSVAFDASCEEMWLAWRHGAGATVGRASLVTRGEAVPPRTRWTGNPIAPWYEKPE